jgi:hypothetical protein
VVSGEKKVRWDPRYVASLLVDSVGGEVNSCPANYYQQ